MSKEIFSGLHNSKTVIRVVYGRETGDGSLGLDVLISGQVVARYYSPQNVSDWFKSNSSKLLPDWQKAYHTSGLTEDSFKKPLLKDVTLDVPYFSQRDNLRDPLGTCNVTSYAMALTFKGAKRKYADKFKQFEDELEYFLEIHKKDRHAHTDLVWMGKQYGVDCSFNTNRTWDSIRFQIRSGNPVVISGFFTSSGHIIVLRGTQGEDFIANDPYGNALSRPKYSAHNGAGVVYPLSFLQKTSKNTKECTWAHFFD